MVASATIEREVKVSVPAGYALPDLSDVMNGGSVGEREDQRLDAVYFDTADLRLLRRGVTVRFRRGEPPGEVWTVKLPAGTPAVGLARREVTLPGQEGDIPRLLAELVGGWALGASLRPVARLRTRRRRTTLRAREGRALAVLDDDEVSIRRGSRVAARFRELEIELADDAAPESLLRRVLERLEAAGAEPVEQVPKLVRALAPAGVEPWELAVSKLGARPTAAEVIQVGLGAAAARFVDHYAAVVLDEDPEGVHQARVGIRRLRSDMRTFGRLLDRDRLAPLREELGWLGRELGAVRDLDVLLASLGAEVRRVQAADRPRAEELLTRLADARAGAYGELREAMRSERCARLLEDLRRLIASPPFASGDAERPAAEVVPTLVRRPLRRLRREAKQLDESPDDSELHRVRILAKRVRYAADVAAPLAGRPGRRATNSLARLQDVLGEHNDACVALARLRELSDDATPSQAWAAGLLGGLQLARAADSRARFPAAYEAAVANKRWTWIP
jgi:CHAD domain-containing protein